MHETTPHNRQQHARRPTSADGWYALPSDWLMRKASPRSRLLSNFASPQQGCLEFSLRLRAVTPPAVNPHQAAPRHYLALARGVWAEVHGRVTGGVPHQPDASLVGLAVDMLLQDVAAHLTLTLRQQEARGAPSQAQVSANCVYVDRTQTTGGCSSALMPPAAALPQCLMPSPLKK